MLATVTGLLAARATCVSAWWIALVAWHPTMFLAIRSV
jgi:hypothetical protein